MAFLAFCLLIFQFNCCYAVKHWMFKRCDQNPFCERNRNYATGSTRAEYLIDPSSVKQSIANGISGNIVKVLTDKEAEVAIAPVEFNGRQAVLLPFKLEVVTDNIVHLLIDEKDRKLNIEDKDLEEKLNPARYSPADLIIDKSQEHLRKPENTVKFTNASTDGMTIVFGENNSAYIDYKSVTVTVNHKGVPLVILNRNGYFNVDHLRRQQPDETTFDWEDRFDNYVDHHVRGPESVAMDISFEGFKHLYGIPEHADSLSLKDTTKTEPYRLFNVDIFEYETDSPMPMYGSIPLITAHRADHAAGVFWLNAADTYVDIAKLESQSNSHWISETGKLDAYILLGDAPSEVLSNYGLLTGTSQLPQQFAIGYHQCRWNYQTQEELLNVNTKMDKHDIPYDVIWLDLEWSDDRRYFAWNTETFPDSEKMMAKLNETRRKLVLLNDPHIKARDDYDVYSTLKSKNLLVKDTDGKENYHAHCWPGRSSWIDTLNPAASSVWSTFHALGTKLGSYAKNLYLWSDMSEPSVFSGSETTAYKSVVHYGGWQHRDVHNLYGHTIFNATYNALYDRYNGEQRPFVLTRSFFSGSQKLGPTWTGDNQAEWQYLRASVPMVLTLGVSGYPFAGADVGGFFRNPSDELLVRWYQAGTFYPFFRAHAHVDSRYREPYLLDAYWRDLSKKAIELRYQLLPEFYTRFWDSHQKLQPIMRPLFYEYPEDPKLGAIEDQFFIGTSLMAKPILTEAATSVSVVLPGDDLFYNYFTGELVSNSKSVNIVDGLRHLQLNDIGFETVPLYVKGGSMVFRKDRHRRSSELMRNDPYTVLIAIGKNGTAQGHLYADDGISFDYRNEDDYVVLNIEMNKSGIRGTVQHKPSNKKAPFASSWIERIIVYGGDASKATYSNTGALDVIPFENGYVIRNPRVKISEDWLIELE